MFPRARRAAEATSVSAPIGTNQRTARVEDATWASQIKGAATSRTRTHTVETATVIVAMKDSVARISCGASNESRGSR